MGWAVSGDKGDLGARGEGGDCDGGRGFTPWLGISLSGSEARELTVSISRVLLYRQLPE
jgi:hypothetical protein